MTTIAQIYATLQALFTQGLMFHNQLYNYFLFLGLKGYAQEQYHHYIEESKNFLKFQHYYITHYHHLLDEERINNPNILPQSWFTKSQDEIIDKKDFVANGFKQWIEWERSVKNLLCVSAERLRDLGDTASYFFLSDFIRDVDNELAAAEQQLLELQAINFDMTYIIDTQEKRKENFQNE